MRKNHGFTLIEILVVLVIIGLMAALVAPKVIGRGEEARVSAARIQIAEIDQAVTLYRLDNSRYPTTGQGLAALVKNPETSPEAKFWRQGGYMKKLPEDPWGEPYRYRCPGNYGDFDIMSLGPDGREGTEDDINGWE